MIRIDSLDDPRVVHYRNVKDRELAREGGRFIAEGELVVRRLFKSDYPVESVLLADRRVDEIAALAPPGTVIYSASNELLRGMIGYHFQSGVMAVGRRKPWTPIDWLISRPDRRLLVVVCPEIANVQNLGGLIRLSAAFGAAAMLLGERCHDPFWRQSVRVSMGTIFSLPLIRSQYILNDLQRLKSEGGFELIAAVLDPDAEPLAPSRRTDRQAILFGNEAQGLSPEQVAACDRRVTIPMAGGTDSLNVAVAAGIFLHHFASAPAEGANG